MNTVKKTALVTGAGKGIGRAIALKLTQQEIHVIAVARTAEDLDSLREESGKSVTKWCLDATGDEILAKIAEEERIDILVNNVGTNIPESFIGVSEQNLDHMLSLNVRTAFRVAQAVSRKMVAARSGSIVHISSQMGHVGAANRTVYCMTKHAIEGLSKAMAVELAPYGVRSNTVAPTFIETPMTRPMFEQNSFKQEVLSKIPLGHVGHVDDVAEAVAYLVSTGARMVTGASLVVDGGWTAH